MRGLSFKQFQLFSCLFLALYWTPAQGVDCSTDELETMIRNVQLIYRPAVNQGEALLQCPRLKDSVIQWLSFYFALSEKLAKSGESELAAHGHDLKGQPAPSKTETFDAKLTSARALIREGQFERGREVYVSYLKLMPQDEIAEAEYYYSFIWEGNLDEAEKRFRAMTSWKLTPFLSGSVVRGLALIQRLKARKSAPLKPSENVFQDPSSLDSFKKTFEIQGSVNTSTDLYQRQTLSFGYFGPVGVFVKTHHLKINQLEAYQSDAAELAVQYVRLIRENFLTFGSLGWFSLGKDHLFGEASASSYQKWRDFRVAVGLNRKPLILSLPLTSDAKDLMREALFFSMNYKDQVELKSELRRETNYAFYEYHVLTGFFQIFKGPNVDDYIRLKVPAIIENHPKPSSHYRSDRKSLGLGLHAEAKHRIAPRWVTRVETSYDIAYKTAHGSDSARRAGVFSCSGEVLTQVAKKYFFVLTGLYQREDDEEPLFRPIHQNEIRISLAM